MSKRVKDFPRWARQFLDAIGTPPRLAVDRRAMLRLAAAEAPKGTAATWAEFGVRKGKSARRLLHLMPRDGALHLFDSWEGLPEGWKRRPGDTRVEKGTFACPQPDLVDDRCTYWPGWFVDTTPAYLEAHPGPIGLAHLDCDLYSSTATVLTVLGPLFAEGTVLIFDDLFNYPLWREHQWRAWQEWIGTRPHQWIARTRKGQAAVRLGAVA